MRLSNKLPACFIFNKLEQNLHFVFDHITIWLFLNLKLSNSDSEITADVRDYDDSLSKVFQVPALLFRLLYLNSKALSKKLSILSFMVHF